MQETEVMKTLSSKTIKEGRFEIVSDDIEVNGHLSKYDYIKIRSGACILPILGDDIVILREYRYPIKRYVYQLPGGFIDEGESPNEAAVRELYEETGLSCSKLIDLGYFHPSFGSTNETIYLFAAICDKEGQSHTEAVEVIKTLKVKKEDVDKFIANNEFTHAAGIAALYKYFNLKH